MANFAQKEGDRLNVFLLAKSVDCESLDSGKFKVTEQMHSFLESGGEILACGSCLRIRQSDGTEMCPLSTMKDLYSIIAKSEKVVSF